MLLQVLEQIGLTEKEATIYLALLEMGAQGATTISNKTQINRSTCYLILENLSEKGLISTHTESNVQYFEALEPSSLLTYINKRQNELVIQQNIIQNNMPYLEAIKKENTGSTKTKYYKGADGILNLYLETLKTNERLIYSFLNISQIPKELLNVLEEIYVKERIKNKIEANIIYITSKNTEDKHKSSFKDEESLRHMKYIETDYSLSVEIQCIGNKTIITNFSPENTFGILIENKELAESIKTLHKIMWSLTKNSN